MDTVLFEGCSTYHNGYIYSDRVTYQPVWNKTEIYLYILPCH